MGIDVGGERKGFDLAVVDADLTLVDSGAHLGIPDVIGLVKQWNPAVIAVDSPCEPAPPGDHLRECELQLNSAVCGIRWTPDISAIEASNYYAWIRNGFRLYAALEGVPGVELIEVFPTASWTRWAGKRVARRARWTREALAQLPVSGLPPRNNQDFRDSVAAAVTAWQYSRDQSESFGPIVVPVAGNPTAYRPLWMAPTGGRARSAPECRAPSPPVRPPAL
jgi:predicted nuclease with RNAse H fold